jgi:hypothetical protein
LGRLGRSGSLTDPIGRGALPDAARGQPAAKVARLEILQIWQKFS